MSIALDAALFLREQKITNTLTLAERGVLFTLFFRVGSNPFCWVSQEALATELDVSTRQVIRCMKSISKKGFIEICQNLKDKRKNLYRASEFLINYHQLNNRKPVKDYKKKIKKGKKYVTNMSPNLEEYVTDMSPNLEEYVTDMSLNSENNSSQVIDNKKEKQEKKKRKATYIKATIKAKGEKKQSKSNLPPDFSMSDENKELAISRGIDPDSIFKSFCAGVVSRGWIRSNWDAALMKWILEERVEKTKRAYTKKEKSTFADVENQSTSQKPTTVKRGSKEVARAHTTEMLKKLGKGR